MDKEIIKQARSANQAALDEVTKAKERLNGAIAASLVSRINLDKIYNSLPSAIIIADAKGTIIEPTNNKTTEIFGYTQYELLGRNVTTLMLDDDAKNHDIFIKSYLTTGIKHVIDTTRQVVGRHKNGSAINLILSVIEFTQSNSRYFAAIISQP